MGLLSDPKSTKRMAALIVSYYNKICCLCYISGLIWFALLASDAFNNKTYFSENALLPSLVVREFKSGSVLNRLAEKIKEEAKSHPLKAPFSLIETEFRELGLDVYEHNFSLKYPFGAKSVVKGKNVYAVLRAPKKASTESLVLSTPFRGPDSIHDNTYGSIALMIELAKAFRRHAYWSKDVIFLVTQHEMIGFQAWLDAYHKVSSSKYINSGELSGSSGLIQGVVNLEISADANSYIDIKIEGLNGQLPNLDLFNLAVELCNREMVSTAFHSRFNYYPSSQLTWESWQHNVVTMLSMMGIQSTGLPTGGHGLFHRFGIQAITLASRAEKGSRRTITLTQIGRVLEGMFRSLNNLLEKFHQSFFFYLLPSTRSYVSIGTYMQPFALIAAPVLVKALHLYVSIELPTRHEVYKAENSVSLWCSLDVITINHVFGTLLYFSPMYVDYFQQYTQLSVSDSLYYIHLVLICSWFLFICCYTSNQKMTSDQHAARMCIVLLELGAFLYTLSLINISMAVAIAVVFVPISICLQYRGRMSFVFKLFLFLINPFVISYVMIVAQSKLIDSNAMFFDHFIRALAGHKKMLLFTIEDLYFFGNWNYQINALILLPLWFELWTLRSICIEGT